MAMARQCGLTALAWRRASVFTSHAAARLRFHISCPAAAASAGASVFLSNRGPKKQSRATRLVDFAPCPIIQEFLQLVEKGKTNTRVLHQAFREYPRAVESRAFDHRTTNALVKMLHINYRLEHLRSKQGPPPIILRFADQLVEDMRTGKIWPSPKASLRLISLCKETKQYEKGKSYWAQLVDKDGAINAGTYGSYIELLSEDPRVPLADLEALYQEALRRFPGDFASYHLSHNAILPDRKVCPRFAGMSAHLLQGITSARLLRGDWKNAYLGLDTAFRIWGYQFPIRFLQIFRQRRPIAESHRIFMMICQSGLRPPPQNCVLQASLNRDLLENASFEERGRLLLYLMDLLQAYVGSGGPASHHFVTIIMKSLETLVASPYEREPEHQPAADLVARTAREICTEFADAGVESRVVTMAARIHLLGKTLDARELGIAIQDVQSMRAKESDQSGSLERNVLLAAGKIKHHSLLVEAWSDLLSTIKNPNASDWGCLAVACRDASYKSFFLKEFANAKDVPKASKEEIMRQLDWKFNKSLNPKFKNLSLEATQAIMDALKSKVKEVASLIGHKRVHNFHDEPLPFGFDGVRVGTPEAMREVYNKLTTDPLIAGASEEEAWRRPPPMSPTGIPMNELRFRNWVGLTECLKLAELFEQQAEDLSQKAKKTENVVPLPWNQPPPTLLSPPIEDPAELLEEVKRLRGITELSSAREASPSLRQEEIRSLHQHKL